MSFSKKDISIIIPCYNTQPEFIQEAIDSIKQCNLECSYNIIIVNDGSDNAATLKFLELLNDSNVEIINQENKGLASAKNTGVLNTSSDYIFFLDSDDRLKPGYIEKGISILSDDADCGVVYANANAFGDESRISFKAKPFDIVELLIQNYIPACVVMRKKVWEDTGGFDENLRKYEDWEFWVNVYKTGWKFTFIDEPMFEYRIHANSLLGKAGEKEFKAAIEYIYKKHWYVVYKVFHQLYASRIIYKNDMQRPLRSFIKFSKKKYLH